MSIELFNVLQRVVEEQDIEEKTEDGNVRDRILGKFLILVFVFFFLLLLFG